jgi:hypothetical protein
MAPDRFAISLWFRRIILWLRKTDYWVQAAIGNLLAQSLWGLVVEKRP